MISNEVSSSNISAYAAEVDLAWTYGDISAVSYDYPTTLGNVYGDMH